MVTVWSIKPFKALFAKAGRCNTGCSSPDAVPGQAGAQDAAHRAIAHAYEAVYKFDWLSATGTAIMLGAVLAIVLSEDEPGRRRCARSAKR